MALNTTATYTTYAEFIAHTPVASQNTILEADWLPWALRAEAIVDSYVGCVTPAVDGQALKFPTLNDDCESEIPDDVIRATIEITSDLIVKSGTDETSVLNPSGGGSSASEEWSGTSYKKTSSSGSSSTDSSVLDFTSMVLPPLATRLLRRWCVNTAAATY